MRSILAIATLAVALAPAALSAQQPAPDATIGYDRARSIALSRVGANEGVKSEKLKTRDGILVYEIDIETPGAGHREIRVNAHTGAIVADKHEDDLIGGAAKKAEKAAKKAAKATEKAVDKAADKVDKVFSDDDIRKMNPPITEARARAIATSRVRGEVKDVDLETENGILVWEVDVDTPGKGHEEILIDAHTGAVLSQKHE